ncbi:MAG: mechanosensitive ion channel family protein [Cyanobium sp.]
MNMMLQQVFGWFGFLNRPHVLEQLLCAGLVFALVALLQWRLPRVEKLPRLGRLLLGVGLAAALAASLGRRFGLLLLVGQILAASGVLRLVERWLLGALLPPTAVRGLVSQILRPAFFLTVLIVSLDAIASLHDLAAISLGTWFGGEIDLGTLFKVLVVLYFVVVGSNLPATGVGWLAKRSLGLSEGSQRALITLVRYVVIALGLIWSLTQLGIDRTGLLAVAGGLSVGLGFGVKEVFSNFISGLWLLIEGSVRPGEVLMLDGEACEVRRLDLRAATLLRASDNAELVVPNQSFFTATTTTYTRSDRTRHCSIEVSAPSSWTPDRMMPLLESLAASHPQVLSSPPPRAELLGFGPKSHSYRLMFSIVDPLRANAITAEVKLSLWRRFDAEGLLNPESGSSSPA